MRPVTAARLLLGSAGLLLTRRVLPLWGADPQNTRVAAVARVLAARHLLQGAAVAAHPSRRTHLASAAVDGLHGVSMLTLAVVSPSYRRPATTSACLAFALASLTGGRLTPRLAPQPAGNARDDADPEVVARSLERYAHDRAAWLTHRTEHVLRASTDAPLGSLSRAGAAVLLLLGVWLVAAPSVLDLLRTSAVTATGTRDEGIAVLLVLAALRLLVADRSVTATGVTFVCAALLAGSGVFLVHSVTRAAVNEVACGVLAVLCAIATLDHRRLPNS